MMLVEVLNYGSPLVPIFFSVGNSMRFFLSGKYFVFFPCGIFCVLTGFRIFCFFSVRNISS